MPYVSKPMKLVTVWFTQEQKAFLDELAKTEDVTLSKALREGRSFTSRTRRGSSGQTPGSRRHVVRTLSQAPYSQPRFLNATFGLWPGCSQTFPVLTNSLTNSHARPGWRQREGLV